MDVKIKNKTEFEKIISLTLVDKDFEEERNTAVLNIGKELKIKGFRPGKIPPAIIEREVGLEYINQNAIELALQRLVFDVLKDEEIQPAVTPSIQKIENKKDKYNVEVVITLWPKIKKLPKTDIKITISDIDPTEEELEEQVQTVVGQFAEVELVERAADSGDYVTINLNASRNGQEIEELTVQDHLYEIGSGNFTEALDKNLEGSKAGAIIKFKDFPQGKQEDGEAEFSVLVKDVRRKVLPDLTDKWVKEILDFESVAALEEEFKSNLAFQNKRRAVSEFQNKLVTELISKTEDTLPEQLVITETEAILRRFLLELEQSSISLEDYFKATGINEDKLKEDLTKQATNNLKMILILDKVIEQNDIQLDDFDTKEIEDHLKTHDSDKDEIEIATHKLSLENEQIRNKALIHLMNEATPIDSKGEEVYLKDVYTQDRETREEE